MLSALGLNAKSKEVFDIIDHAEKVPQATTKENLETLGLSKNEIEKVVAFSNLHGQRDFVVKTLKNLGIEDETYNEGVDELDVVLGLLESQGLSAEADMKIVRGLDYYTGTVFEFVLPEYRAIGSVCGGGRYENLTGNFTDQIMPGVGGSIGLTRLFYVLNASNLIKDKVIKPIDYALIPISENEIEYAFEVAKKLRDKGNKVDIVLTDKKLGDKMTYAAKIAKNGVVIGESEVESGAMKAKDFDTGTTSDLEI